MGTQLPPKRGHSSLHFLAHVYCGQLSIYWALVLFLMFCFLLCQVLGIRKVGESVKMSAATGRLLWLNVFACVFVQGCTWDVVAWLMFSWYLRQLFVSHVLYVMAESHVALLICYVHLLCILCYCSYWCVFVWMITCSARLHIRYTLLLLLVVNCRVSQYNY